MPRITPRQFGIAALVAAGVGVAWWVLTRDVGLGVASFVAGSGMVLATPRDKQPVDYGLRAAIIFGLLLALAKLYKPGT